MGRSKSSNFGLFGGIIVEDPEYFYWPRHFNCAEDAVIFADGFLQDPKTISQMGRVKKDKVQQNRRPGSFSINDIADMAATISVELSRLDNKCAALMYRFVFGVSNGKDGLFLADELTRRSFSIDDQFPEIRTQENCRILAAWLMQRTREKRRIGKTIPIGKIAADFGLKRSNFYKVWGDERDTIQEIIDNWIEQADRQMTRTLSDLHIIG